MNLKNILLITYCTTTAIVFCSDIKTTEAIRNEVKKAIEDLAWAMKLTQSNAVTTQPTSIHNHIHNAATSGSTSNPTSSAIAANEPEQTKKDSAVAIENKIGIQEFLKTYAWHTSGIVISTWYLYAFYQIYQTNKLLNNPYSWALFKEEIPVTRLTTIQRAELFKELHLAICKKYLNSADCDNGQKVMLKFLADLSYEKSRLESYLIYQTVISNCYLSKLFPTFKKTEQVEESIARINFLMDLYIEFFIIKDQNK